MKELLLLGFGAMGRDVYAQLQNEPGLRIRHVLEQPGACAALQAELGPACAVIASLDALSARPDLALECAGHAAVLAHVPRLLRDGVDTILASVGSLASAGVPEQLAGACAQGGSQLFLVPGALAGIDALAAARHYGLERVRYTGSKPPLGWAGTLAEELCDLRALRAPCTFFEGSARDAARQFPKNANVAAMVGIAGIGMDRTQVALIADPGVSRNTHMFSAEGVFGRMEVRIEAHALAANPKTSALAAMSIVRQVRNQVAPIVV